MSLVIDVGAPTTGLANAKTRIQKGIFCVTAVLGTLNIRVIAAKTARLHDRISCAGVEPVRPGRMVEVQSMSEFMSEVVWIDSPACTRINATTSALAKIPTTNRAWTGHGELLVTAHNLG